MTAPDVAVVGAGQVGLALGYYLKARGLAFEILDTAPSLGHVWRTRWDSLRLFTPAQYAGLPGLPFPAPRDTYPTKDQVAGYLASYAATFDLPVRLNTRVTGLQRSPDHGYLLTTGSATIWTAPAFVETWSFVSRRLRPLGCVMPEVLLELQRRAVPAPRVQPLVIVPENPFRGSQRDLRDVIP